MTIDQLNSNLSSYLMFFINRLFVFCLASAAKINIGSVILGLCGVVMVICAVPSQAVTFDANESPPYWSESMDNNGMGGEIVAALSQQAEIPINIRFKPLKRLMNDTTNNDLGDPIFFMSNQDFASIIPIAVYHISLFYYQPNHEGEVIVRRFEDLSGYRVGILKGTLVESTFFDKAGVAFETSYAQDSLFKKLKLGRIDFALRIELAADQSIEKLFPGESDDFKVVENFKMTQPIAMMISENYPDGEAVGEQLKASLDAIIKNGQYHKIIQKHYKGKIPVNWFNELAKFQRLYDF